LRKPGESLRAIYRYGSRRFGSPKAQAYVASLRTATLTIGQFPLAGHVYVSALDFRYHRFDSGRHALFYQFEDDAILIGRILHVRMDFDRQS
jgi:plasmid stabilization system protein ParE